LHVHADYPPPRSWEQFEELCADIFQAEWRDPALVRNGRAGQEQNGVDIVGRNGAIYPIGLQCKKKRRWPVSKLTSKEIDDEVDAARAFDPPLKAFYLLTTAADDGALQAHVRTLNAAQRKGKSFEVILLGWSEIVRRATLHPAVADKHFGARGSAARSPLHAVFYLNKGRLEATGEVLALSVRELIQDFRDDPCGHVLVRQRESDALVNQIAALGNPPQTTRDRKTRISLRDQLHRLERQEARAAEGVRLMLTDPEMTDWLLEVWDPAIAVQAVISFLDREAVRAFTETPPGAMHLRMSPKREPTKRASALLLRDDVAIMQAKMGERFRRYGQTLTNTVMELPESILGRLAVPRLVRDIVESQQEDRLTHDQMRAEGRFDLGSWTVDMA
jgi:hypothetical protein